MQYPAPLDDDRLARLVHRLLIAPDTLAPHPTSGAPLLCGARGCTELALDAAVAAVAELAADGSGPEDWRWGRRHALRFLPVFPDPTGAFVLPATGAYPREGDTFSIDRADGGYADTDFTPHRATAYRVSIARPIAAPLALRLELPGGTVLDIRDPHYRDLLETSYLPRTAVDVPSTINDITAAGGSRWELR